tara:strand:- start:445 stop:666 length:222 start_codon:yes stop_codon:yes gene_type:complete
MPEGYTGTNVGSFTFAQLTGILFPSITDSFFHSLSIDDIYSGVDPLNTIFTPVDSTNSIFSPVDSIEVTFTPA